MSGKHESTGHYAYTEARPANQYMWLFFLLLKESKHVTNLCPFLFIPQYLTFPGYSESLAYLALTSCCVF